VRFEFNVQTEVTVVSPGNPVTFYRTLCSCVKEARICFYRRVSFCLSRLR